MLTALDTNVLLDILIPNDDFADAAESSIEAAASNGLIVVCDMGVEPVNREAPFLASGIWRRYRKQGGKRTSALPGFIVGAHASVQKNRLISRDRGFYRSSFPDLSVCDPSVDFKKAK